MIYTNYCESKMESSHERMNQSVKRLHILYDISIYNRHRALLVLNLIYMTTNFGTIIASRVCPKTYHISIKNKWSEERLYGGHIIELSEKNN